jgi:hypothetical protein
MHEQCDKRSVSSDKWELEARIQVRTLTGMKRPSQSRSGPISYHSDVHRSELSSQESAWSSSATEEEEECLLRCASDRISRQIC